MLNCRGAFFPFSDFLKNNVRPNLYLVLTFVSGYPVWSRMHALCKYLPIFACYRKSRTVCLSLQDSIVANEPLVMFMLSLC